MVHFPRSWEDFGRFLVRRGKKYRNLALYLPASVEIHQKTDELPAKYKIVEVVCSRTFGFTTK